MLRRLSPHSPSRLRHRLRARGLAGLTMLLCVLLRAGSPSAAAAPGTVPTATARGATTAGSAAAPAPLPGSSRPPATARAHRRAVQAGPKIYISADMEGVAGVVTGEQLGPEGFEYAAFRRYMTEETLAAIEGARAAGAGEILVSDSHGNGQNLLIDMFPEDVEIVRSWPRPLMMMEGIDETFDGAIFIGYHAGTTNPDGVRAHTMSSARLADVRINGGSVPEAGINAAIAGHFGVPVIMISGDEAIAAEAAGIIGPVEAAVVKRSISFHSARTMTPAAARELIRTTAQRAVRRLDEFRPHVVGTPVTGEVRFKNYRPSQVLALLPLFERIDAHAVRFQAADMLETSRILHFILQYGAVLDP